MNRIKFRNALGGALAALWLAGCGPAMGILIPAGQTLGASYQRQQAASDVAGFMAQLAAACRAGDQVSCLNYQTALQRQTDLMNWAIAARYNGVR